MASSNTVQNGWVIQLPTGFTWNGYDTTTTKPTAEMATSFTSDTPLKFFVSGSTTSTGDLKINLNLTITNNTGTTWAGFRVDYVDVVSPTAQYGALHPYFAHFHDSQYNFADPSFSGFANAVGYNGSDGDLQNPNYYFNVPSVQGATEIRFSNGQVTSSTTQSMTVGVHQWPTANVPNGDFYVVLTPQVLLQSQSNIFTGTAADDVINGSAADETIIASNGFDTIDGGGGTNTWDWSSMAAGSAIPTDLTVWLWAQYSAIDYAPNTFTQYNYLDSARNAVNQGQYDHVKNVQNVIGLSNHPNHLEGDANANHLTGGSFADVLNGYGGADTLTGGGGADKFVLDNHVLSTAVAAIADYDQGGAAAYNSGEGDQIDLSALLSTAYNHGNGQAVSSLVRVMEAASGTFATVQIDTDGSTNGANWVTIARLDGLHAGNSVNVILDASMPGGSTLTSSVGGGIVLTGSGLILGTNGDDTLTGSAGPDSFHGEGGNDFLDGGPGVDTAVFSGAPDNFQWGANPDGTFTITDLRAGSPEGTDVVKNVEVLEFDVSPDAAGGTTTTSYDIGHSFSWSTETRTYDAQGTLKTIFDKADAGPAFFTDYNIGHVDPWNAAVTTYDAQGRLQATSIYKDVTLVTTYDAAGNQSWSQAVTGYDSQGRLDYVTVVNDDHSSLYTRYSYSGNIDYSIYTYDAQNHLTQSYIHHPNGTYEIVT